MKIKVLDKVYNQCVIEGLLQKPEQIDNEKAKSLLDIVEQDLDTLKDIIPIMEKKKNFGMIWKNQYEIVRQLVQGILIFEKVKSENHQCMFAHLCKGKKDIDWETVETIRLLRNGVHYQGRPVSAEIWKEYKVKFEVYIRTFIRILRDKLDGN